MAGLGLVAALALQGAAGAPVGAAGAPAAAFRSHPLIPGASPPGSVESALQELGWSATNWSGYALGSSTAGAYRAVTGCWTVPAVSASATPTFSSAWIGIDGFDGGSYLIQTGTEQDWYSGFAHYAAWWEILTPANHNPATTITSMSIDPGDSMCAGVAEGTEGNWTISLTDETIGAHFSTVQSYSGPGVSAEWILERPFVNGVISTLAAYGQTTFDPGSVNGGNPDLVADDGGDMLQDGIQASTPSNPDSDTDGFAVAYGSTPPSPPASDYTPTPTSVSPSSGSVQGGQSVTIGGAGFVPGATVAFGVNQATGVLFSSPYQLTALTPPGSVGAVTVMVTDPGGSSGSDTSAYTYVLTAYTALQPYRICDTRSVSVTGYGTECSGNPIGQGGTLDVQITGVSGSAGQSVPADTQSVVLNVTAISGTRTTYLTAFPAGSAPPNASNLNVTPNLNQANLVVVALGTGGQVGIYNSAGTINVAVDVEGYFAPSSVSSSIPGLFHPIPPLRICDTRLGSGTACSGDSLGQGQWEKVVVSGCPTGEPSCTASVPTTDAAAVALNLTAVAGGASTFLSVAPPNASDQCPGGAPGISNLNVAARTDLPDRVIVPLGPDQDVCVYNSAGNVDFVLDVNGWFGNGSESTPGASFYTISPTRICDTRSTAVTGYGTECSGQTLGQGSTLTIPVAGVDGLPPAGGSSPPVALIANVTAVSGTANTYFTLYPADVTQPLASDINVGPGQVTPNLAIVQLATTGPDAGSLDLFNDQGSINAILDVAGWFQ